MRAFDVLRRGAVEAFLLFAAFLAGMTAWVFVAFREESTWDNYMSSHGGMPPPPDFVAAHQLSAYTMPALLWTPVLLVLLYRFYLRATRRSDTQGPAGLVPGTQR